jgi:beta-1,2-mannobiose phosphorylase / 1,2-beta-oligomannan phosphorylase
MSYVAFGPLGPRTALAVSEDLRSWRRLGPLHFEYQPDLDTDLNLFPNKDVVLFPEPVPGPDGELAYAMLHRPMWDLGWILGTAEDEFLPAGLPDPRPGIWISYVPVDAVERDIRALTHVRAHRLVALAEYDFEDAKIGAGPPPLRVEEGWLLIHHGVSGHLDDGWGRQQDLLYAAGAMLLDPADPARVLARTSAPLLSPAVSEERVGTVPNVVFPTAIEEVDGQRFVFYGMADSSIGVARLDRAR